MRVCALFVLLTTAVALATAAPVTPERQRREAEGELLQAIVVTRHGDRTPVALLPNDVATWDEELGQLTAIGMRQHFELGKKFRQRYVDELGALSPSYVSTEVYLRSTDVDRTLMSAQSQMMGLFPSGTGPWINTSTAGLPGAAQAVPIHTVPVYEDDLLRAFDWGHCGRYDALRERMVTLPQWVAKEAAEADYIATMRTLTGNKDADLEGWYGIYDPLFCEWSHGKPWPPGVTDTLFQKSIELANFRTNASFHHGDVGRLAGGNLVREIVTRLEDRALGLSPNVFVLFSAHDTTCASLLAALPDGYNGVLPPYASHIVFELWKDTDGEYYVHASYNDVPLNVGSCGSECRLTEFSAATSNSYFSDWEAACANTDLDTPATEPPVVASTSGLSGAPSSSSGMAKAQNNRSTTGAFLGAMAVFASLVLGLCLLGGCGMVGYHYFARQRPNYADYGELEMVDVEAPVEGIAGGDNSDGGDVEVSLDDPVVEKE